MPRLLTAAVLTLVILRGAPANAQTTAPPNADTLGRVAETSDRTGTNPANLRDTLAVANEFLSVGDHLFLAQFAWQYGQGFAGRRMRARVVLPFSFANVTGRTEVGFGDVVLGWEWVAAVRGRVAWLAGADASLDTSTNAALSTGHSLVAPGAGLVFVPRPDTVVSVTYRHAVSLDAEDDRPDVNEGSLEAAIVRRFGDGMWVRAVPTLVADHEGERTYGVVEGEWGRMLTDSASTWVRVGRAFGADHTRPFDRTLVVGFRFVR